MIAIAKFIVIRYGEIKYFSAGEGPEDVFRETH